MQNKITRIALLALVLMALLAQAALSVRAIRVEQREARERSERRRETALDLALWRLDAALAPLIAAESSRSSEQFESVYEEPGAANREGAVPILDGLGEPLRVFVPSPLLRRTSPFLRLHFQWANGAFRSPQVPRGPVLESALQRGWTDRESVEEALGNLVALEAGVEGEDLAHFLSAPRRTFRETPRSRELAELFVSLQRASRRGVQPVPGAQTDLSQGFVPYLHPGSLDPSESGTEFELFLLRFSRSESAPERRTVQGIWIDWTVLHPWLLEQLEAHLPAGTRLLPVDAKSGDPRHRLATLRVLRLEAPPLAAGDRFAVTPVRGALALAWVMLLAALFAMTLALRAAWQLSDRRGRFVAGVTHELRTPLTTFCLYSEMLADGVVREQTAKQEYLEALRTQSQRLRRVVENVLAYAGLEGHRARAERQVVPLQQLVSRVLPVLASRAGEAGLSFSGPEPNEIPRGFELDTDEQAVEQVLFNLVDNAAKYCESGTPLDVSVAVNGQTAAFAVEDRGPGLPDDVRAKAFDAFRRGAAHSRGEIGGLGLGLHLARELSGLAGGHLHFESPPHGGSRFVLELPVCVAKPAEPAAGD